MFRSASFMVFGALVGLACASSSDAPDGSQGLENGGGAGGGGTASGGAPGAAGNSGAGLTSTGGAAGSGKSTPTGGDNSGGMKGAGGNVASGGDATTGGNLATGGSRTTGGSSGSGGTSGDGGAGGSASLGPVRHVFVIAMENHDGTSIYGNTTSAPFINGTLIPNYAKASSFTDPLPLAVPSEPHYVWMEAGTNAFADYTFTNDDDPSAANSTSSTAHLTTQIDAKAGLSWRAYQEGLDSTTGACPIHASGFYAPKHDPFIFFQDVSGNPPSATNATCAAHHRSLSELGQDLANNDVASYNFITPNQCDDMHGQFGCPSFDLVKPGDDWLAANVPALVSFCNANDGVIFVVWDEGEGTSIIPFLAIGPGVKKGYSSGVTYTHSSLVKSVEEIFELPVLPAVASANDFADLFESGAFP